MLDGTLASPGYNPQNPGAHGYHEKDGYVAFSQVPRAGNGADITKPNRKKRKVCGIPMLWLIAAIVSLVVIVGGVVGGVVGTKANKKPTSGDPAAESDVTASIDTSILLDTASPTATQTGSASFVGTSTAASIEPTNTIESQFKSDYFYRVTNNFLGAGLALDILVTDGTGSRRVNMSATGNNIGQYWQLMRIPPKLQTTSLTRRQVERNPQPQYWISTLYLGQRIRLEVASKDPILPKMADADDLHLGQRWWADEWDDGTWALSNEMNGKKWNMSSYADTNELFMRGDDDDDGQHWVIGQINKIQEDGWVTNSEKLKTAV